ncbi:hypothetical protein MHYP_G00221750 [Metynnis hypsauchen]
MGLSIRSSLLKQGVWWGSSECIIAAHHREERLVASSLFRKGDSDTPANYHLQLVSTLKSKLKKQSTATGSGVARAFLRSQAALFGSYRDALRYKPGEPITFCEESFVAHRSSTMRNFLEMAVNLQLFKQFIDGRLAKLNAGRGFTDVFEEEITEGGFCGSNSRSYQQWMHTVKVSSSF